MSYRGRKRRISCIFRGILKIALKEGGLVEKKLLFLLVADHTERLCKIPIY